MSARKDTPALTRRRFLHLLGSSALAGAALGPAAFASGKLAPGQFAARGLVQITGATNHRLMSLAIVRAAKSCDRRAP